MAIKIGITGGIGSGKSVVSHLLRLMEIPVYEADAEAKRLMLSDSDIRWDLIHLLGTHVYLPEGLNKPLLASYVFGDSHHAEQVNAIVHPRVRDDFRKWTERRAVLKIIGIESAILFEAGFRDEVDVVVMVYAPLDVRIARVVQRDASSRMSVEKRICAQMDDEEKRRMADFVITNDDKTPLLPQVLGLISSLSENH